MALRFLVRDGSRRRLQQAHHNSPHFSHHRKTLAEVNPEIRPSFHGRKSLSEAHHSFRVNSQLSPCRNFLSQAEGSSHVKQALSEATTFHHGKQAVVQSSFAQGLLFPRCGIKAGFHHATSRSFSSGNIETVKKNAASVVSNNSLFKGISTNTLARKFKFSPSIVKKPIDELKETASRYKEVAGLQVEAFWKRNVMILVGVVGVLACFLLWQIMYGVANIFVSFSEGMAKFGFLAMAAATVAFAAMALRARYTINPDKVYRIAMRMLNTSASALEVLGPPLTGTDLRAYVMSSGGLKLKNMRPRIGSRRCFLIFPIQGSERKGLVSAEVKKKKGKYDFKLLAIDVAIPGQEQRIFLVGDEVEYKVGGGLIGQLRDPIFKAMAAQQEFDAQDEKEEQEEQKEEEARREQEMRDEEARRKEEIESLERESVNK